MRTTLRVVPVLCVTAILSACGGGGGGETAKASPTVITQDGQQSKAPLTPVSQPTAQSAPTQPAPTPPVAQQTVTPPTPAPAIISPVVAPPPVITPPVAQTQVQSQSQAQAQTPPSAIVTPVVNPPVTVAAPPEPAQPARPPQAAVAVTPPAPIAVNRSTVDRPDDSLGSMIHVIYAVPKGGVDRAYDLTDRFHNSLHSVNNWLKQKTSNRLEMKFDTYNGEIDITYVALPKTESEYDAGDSMKLVEDDLRSMGQMVSNKIYIIYFDGDNSRTCGEAGSLLSGHQSAVMYLKGFSKRPEINPCENNPIAESRTAQPTYLDYVALHEVSHIIGIPHVYDSEFDLMYGGGTRWDRPSDIVLDFNNDSYTFDRSQGSYAMSQPNMYDSPFFNRIVNNQQLAQVKR